MSQIHQNKKLPTVFLDKMNFDPHALSNKRTR